MKQTETIDKMRPKEKFGRALYLKKKCGKEFYNKYKQMFVDTACPACGGKGESHYSVNGFKHRICRDCMTMWCSPRPTENLIEDYYSYSEATKYWTELLLQTNSDRQNLQHQLRVDDIVKKIKKHRNKESLLPLAVDMGAGSGAFASLLEKSNYFGRVIAVDFDHDCCQFCNHLGLETKQGSVEVLEDKSINIITMNDLIEHLFDPREFLLKCRKKLTDNGYLFIACPNGQGFDFQIMKEKTVNITPPEHLNYFNPYSISLLLESVGFNIISAETPGILDVDIVKRELPNSISMDDNVYLKNLFMNASRETLKSFQEFLIINKLSSHMVILAHKNQ